MPRSHSSTHRTTDSTADFLDVDAVRPSLPSGPFLIVGLGRAGMSAARALVARCGAGAVRAWDSHADEAQRRGADELRAQGVEVRLGGDGIDLLAGAATVVKSPGVPPETPVVAAALARGVEVLDELEIGWRLLPVPIVGVTGTKGKSTTAALGMAILAAHGLDPVLCGNTEFGRAIAETAGGPLPTALVAEVSSYQLEFGGEMMVDAAVFTNLSVDHLNRHASMAEYGAAKRNLFIRGEEAVRVAALNADDEFGAVLAREVEERGGRALRYGRGRAADYRIVDCRWDLRRSELRIETPAGPVELETRLSGPHNASNVTAALALSDGLGLPREPTLAALASIEPVRGRFEAVEVDAPFEVVVDFGICPAGVAAALEAARPIAAARGGRVIAVVCALGRSAVELGPQTGAAAATLADHLILSGSSYRGEPRMPPLAALAEGARGIAGNEVEIVVDRRAAITRAIESARPGDVVALIGRGPTAREATDLRGGFVELEDAAVAREAVASR